MAFTLSYEEAVTAAKEGKRVQSDYFGSGWSMFWHDRLGELFSLNPRTGSQLLHPQTDRDRAAKWRVIEMVVYAGFTYIIDVAAETATPLEDQHAAANKQKHRMAALEVWRDK